MMLFSIGDYDAMAACIDGPVSGAESRCDCFDFDASGSVDLLDFAVLSRMMTPAWRIPTGCCSALGKSPGDENMLQLTNCTTGPGAVLNPGCECFDFDESGAVDLRDYARLMESP